MVFIEAKYKEKPLELKKGVTIQVFIPNQLNVVRDSMQTFVGEESEGIVDKKCHNRRYLN